MFDSYRLVAAIAAHAEIGSIGSQSCPTFSLRGAETGGEAGCWSVPLEAIVRFLLHRTRPCSRIAIGLLPSDEQPVTEHQIGRPSINSCCTRFSISRRVEVYECNDGAWQTRETELPHVASHAHFQVERSGCNPYKQSHRRKRPLRTACILINLEIDKRFRGLVLYWV